MTPEQRDYDRFVAGVIPQGASWCAETAWGIEHGRANLDRMIGYEDESCSCHINPPCSYCTSRVDCDLCGEFVREDKLDEHMCAPREVLTLASEGKIWRTIPGVIWLGPPNNGQYPISAGDYTAQVDALFSEHLLAGQLGICGVLAIPTDAGRALLDTLRKARPCP